MPVMCRPLHGYVQDYVLLRVVCNFMNGGDNKMRKIFVALLALFASAGIANAASQGNSTDLSSTWSTQMQSVPVVVPAGSACGPGTPGIVIHDDGQAENGYGWNAAAGADARLADKFTPSSYPATISNVCMSFITNAGVSTLNFKVAVYDDDGAGGAPGTLLGSKSFVATPAAIAGLPFTPTFQSFDISDLALSIPSGNVYISANWDANVGVGVFLASDETPATPLADGYGYDSTAVWTPLLTDRPNYRALMIRAVMPLAGPGAPSVSKAFAPSQVLEGVSSTLTITLNNSSQPTAAVLAAALTDTFPAGLVVASTPNAATTCASGTVTAVAGSGSVTLSSGASIPAGASCTVKVDVSSAATGSYANTIAAGALQTNHGNNAGAASATLKVGLTFPEPYCPVTFPSAVEPITRVLFDGIDNPSPTTGGPPLQDFTTIIGNVVPGQTLPMTVEGNTSGSFTTKVVAYIDWNQNGVFTDPGELYVIGDLINSTGADGKQVTANIAVPGDALGGSTRMRVMKKFSTQPAPCNSTGYGQAEDYTLNVTPSAEPTVSKSFAPSQVPANSPSSLTITLKNLANAGNATLSAALVDTFPAGLVVAAVPNASTTCGSGVVTANAGDGSVSLAAGATIPGAGQCIVKVDVQSATDGSYANQIAVGALQTDLGANAFAANATLKVGFTFPEPYCPVTFPSGVEPITFVDYAGIANPSSAAVGGSPALENFTAIIGNVSQGEVLPMSVQGNTDGNYTAVITTYIDWNQNGVFDASERYDIGSFVNSTGADGKKATANITVPAGAVLGQTRMRVTKKFNAAAEACNTTGFGQAEDYTLVVTPSQPSVSKAFAPSTIALGETSTATITLKNPTALDATLTAPLVDNLPAGMSVVSATTNCGLILGSAGAGLTGTPGASITLPAGVVLPAGTSCSITVVVETGPCGNGSSS